MNFPVGSADVGRQTTAEAAQVIDYHLDEGLSYLVLS